VYKAPRGKPPYGNKLFCPRVGVNNRARIVSALLAEK